MWQNHTFGFKSKHEFCSVWQSYLSLFEQSFPILREAIQSSFHIQLLDLKQKAWSNSVASVLNQW